MSKSQYAPLRELWDGFSSLGFSRGTFLVLRGYIDESYNKSNIFALSCVLSIGSKWNHLERDWKVYLRGINRKLEKQGRAPISRYHASDCSSLQGEFKDWSLPEQIELATGLFRIMHRYPLHTVAYTMSLEELQDVFPEVSKIDILAAAYSVSVKFLLLEIGRHYKQVDAKHSIVLFHDRSNYDEIILRAFNAMVKDPEFRYASRFRSITPEAWENCVALQPADLVAYEVMKEIERRPVNRNRRKSFEALIKVKGNFGINVKSMNRENLLEIRKIHDNLGINVVSGDANL